MVAVKKISKITATGQSDFMREATCMMKGMHKNIVRFLGYNIGTEKLHVLEKTTPNMLLCSEYISNGSLQEYIKGTGSATKIAPLFFMLTQNSLLSFYKKLLDILFFDEKQHCADFIH